jgi:prepilin-type N-terminal cleavage/methylation domain-containing protein
MRFSRTETTRCAERARAAFTLAEVLAAVVLMAIVIPVAVQAVQVASRAGQVGVRKAAAARVADRVMSELEASGQIQNGTQSGVIEEGRQDYSWNMQTTPWTEGNLNVVTVSVDFEVQGQTYQVRLSTLFDPTITSTNSTSGQAP